MVQKSSDHAQIWEQIFNEISTLSGIAKTNGSVISLRELASLTRTSLSEEQIRQAVETVPHIAVSYRLRNGFIIQHENDPHGDDVDSMVLEQAKRNRAEVFARYANEFASLCKASGTNLLAISGSTSYETPLAADDLDIFCVTKTDSLWIFLTKSLLLARFLQFLRKDAPRLCFSYIVDQEFAENEFPLPRDALFARDALTTMVVYGQDYYRELLQKSPWISNHFPRLYRNRIDALMKGEAAREQTRIRPGQKFLNTFLGILVGNYVLFKSTLLNMRLRKQGKFSALFLAKIGSDHCIFESVRYSRLREMYRTLDDKPNTLLKGKQPAPM